MAVIKAKSRQTQSLGYDQIICLPFPPATITPNMDPNQAVYGSFPLMYNTNFIGVSLYMSGRPGGSLTFNLAWSALAGAGNMIPPINDGNYPIQTAGVNLNGANMLFNQFQIINTASNGVQRWDVTTPAQGGVSNPPQTVATYDAVWPPGRKMTLRFQSDNNITPGYTIYVYAWAKITDINPMSPELYAQSFYPSLAYM